MNEKRTMENVLTEVEDAFKGSTITASDAAEYLDVIREAVEVHIDRERIRHGLWKEYGADDQVRQIKIKAERVIKIFERATIEQRPLSGSEQGAVSEELHDIINYAVFGARTV